MCLFTILRQNMPQRNSSEHAFSSSFSRDAKSMDETVFLQSKVWKFYPLQWEELESNERRNWGVRGLRPLILLRLRWVVAFVGNTGQVQQLWKEYKMDVSLSKTQWLWEREKSVSSGVGVSCKSRASTDVGSRTRSIIEDTNNAKSARRLNTYLTYKCSSQFSEGRKQSLGRN